ncbi:MAG: type II toxin-antitoxin system RelE/ParE family toxin [Syntrophomonadaceae bacterium]|nr:type II toxin-antitoxin system RelE/ParE family toxin [Syntrophomonadaceae bacterium]
MNNLHLSKEAQADLAEIKEYFSKELENPTAALSTLKKITKGMRILQSHALAGPPLSSIANVESDYRFLVHGNFLTFYRVQGDEVYVDRVIYGRRDYLRILFGEVLEEELE